MTKAFITGCSGVELSADEQEFIRQNQPWGFIIFGRNIESTDQLRDLVASFKACVKHDAVPVLVDQEGGRVQRLKAPHWRKYPAAGVLGDIYRLDKEAGLRATWLQSRLMAHDMLSVGINVDCMPVLDVPVEGSDKQVLGDRAYSDDPQIVATMGAAACAGMLAGGVAPVIKHMPGHGRATLDTHYALPVVDDDLETLAAQDFIPFRALNDQRMGMTAHIVFSAIDPETPATQSPQIIEQIVRGRLGFDGLLMSDDISMEALKGDFATRCRKTIDAGCDMILHCNGKMEEMIAVAEGAPELAGKARARASRAMEAVGKVEEADISDLHMEFDELLSRVNWPAVG